MTDTQTDIAIIGGGIAAGARLAPHARVAALEAKARIGYHASGRLAALYEVSNGMTSTVALARVRSDSHLRDAGPRGRMPAGIAGEGADICARLSIKRFSA